MLDDHRDDVALADDLGQVLEQRDGFGGREARGRFVEQHQGRLTDQRERDVDPALVAVGDAVGELVVDGPELEGVDDSVEVLFAELRGHQLQLLADPDAGKDAGALERPRHAEAAALHHRLPRDVAAIDEDAAARRPAPAGDGVHQGRLAGAVRADHAVQHAALRDLEAHGLQRLDAAVGDAQVFNAQHRRRRAWPGHACRVAKNLDAGNPSRPAGTRR